MYTRTRKKVKKIERTIFLFLTISLYFLLVPISSVADVQASQTVGDYVPIKWALIVLGGFDYYRHPPGQNAIQKAEHWIQSRGVPYDVIEDDNIQAPTDTPGEYPLQYANGTIRYQVIVIIMNHYRDSSAVNINQIYSAVGNGTNAVIFGMAAKYVPALLDVSPGHVSYIEDYRIYQINCTIHRTFSDGIKEYQQGSSQTIDYAYFIHASVSGTIGKTVWYTMHSNTGRSWNGMMNTTYGFGRVFWNTVMPSYYKFFNYGVFSQFWEAKNLKFVAHAINFIFNQVERVNVKLQGYKRWAGAIVHRLDEDGHIGLYLLNETALEAGWIVDQVICPLGYMTNGGDLKDGLPPAYTWSPSSQTKWGNFAKLVKSTEPLRFETRNFVVHNSTVGGDYDRMRIDWDNDMDFSDNIEREIWESQTYPGFMGEYYWCFIDDFSNPTEVKLGWWCRIRDRISNFTQWKTWGQQGYVAYGLHSWQHQRCGTGTLGAPSRGMHHNWNGTHFVLNQTWIEQKYTEARNELSYCLGSTGYGFEAEKVLVSHAGNEYKEEVDTTLFNLSWVHLKYGDNAKNEPGWFLYSDRTPTLTCGGGEEWSADEGWRIDAWIDAVKTLFPIFGIYEHNKGTFNLSYTFPPYTDMFCFAHLDDSYEFWSNARYMKRNMVNAYFKSNKIVLEYKANSTLKDYVWKFPLELDGKYFNGFSESRNVGKIKHIDGKYVYVEFSEGGNERLEATYGTSPHICQTSSYIENITQTYTLKNLMLQLWNASGTTNIKIKCTRFSQPSSIEIDGTSVDFNYNSATKTCSFNVTFSGLKTAEVLWARAPPNAPALVSPSKAKRFDPSESVVFSWTFSDLDQLDSQAAFRFQLDHNNDFSSPIIDTGKIVSSSTWTTQTLPNTVSIYYWRVNTWDNQDSEGWWSESDTIVIDRLKISSKGVTDSRTDVGTSVSVYFNISREHDNVVFDGTKGTVYINGSEAIWDETDKYWKLTVAQDRVGEWAYHVSSITDMEYNITAINNLVGTQSVIWDKLAVTITPDATTVPVGTQVDFKLNAVYAYDSEDVPSWNVNILRDGVCFATNDLADTCNTPCTHQYMIENVTETTYGLTAFTSNSPTVTWEENPKTFIQLLIHWLTANAVILVPIVSLIIVASLLVLKRQKTERSLRMSFFIQEREICL